MLDLVPHPVAIVDGRGRVRQANHEARAVAGGDPRGRRLLEMVHPADRAGLIRAWTAARDDGGCIRIDARLRDGDGYRWWRLTGRRSPEDDQRWVGSAVDIQPDVAARAEADHRDALRLRMLDSTADCIKLIDVDGTLREMNRAGCVALGLPPDERDFGMRWLDLLPVAVRPAGRRALATARQGRPARFAGMSQVGDQRPQYWDNLLTPLPDEDGQIRSILCVSRNTTDRHDSERRLREAGEIDHLTGLLNRRSFEKRLRRMVSGARQAGSELGLAMIDLDHFKNINDSLGHPAGDHLLRVVSRRLRRALPAGTVIGRIGGDEFAVVAPQPVAIADVARLARAQLARPILYRGQPIGAGLSIGVAAFPRDAADAADLLVCADTALAEMKADGRGGVREFGSHLRQARQQRAAHLERARTVLDHGVLEAYYQPRVCVNDGSVVGVEALLRWGGAAGTGRLPGDLADAFDDYELATALGNRMRERVLADTAHWLAAGRFPGSVSLNAAPVEFLREDFADRVLNDLHRHGITPGIIEIEITERVLLQRHAEVVRGTLAVLRAAGLRITLDDFGTGRSSLADLREFPVDGLKIHQDFIARMVDDPSIADLVYATIQLGSTLKLTVTAEGVETDEQLRMLRVPDRSLLGQGYLFGAPVPAALVPGLLPGDGPAT